jgi:CYTH domain-containing protein
LAREIVARNPDVIVTGTNPVVIAFKAATSTIPIVAFMLDPLHAGLVTSLMLRTMCDGNVLDKVRHFVSHEGNNWHVDVYEGLLDGVVLAGD